jgi:hypothetical protein
MEFTPQIPSHPLHALIYAQEEGNFVSLRTSTKPIYITDSAPDVVECFYFPPDKPDIRKPGVYRRENSFLQMV